MLPFAASCLTSSIKANRLLELLFVETVRRHAEALPEGKTGWLAGLREPYVARALALLHRDIVRHWTVDDLVRSGYRVRRWQTASFV